LLKAGYRQALQAFDTQVKLFIIQFVPAAKTAMGIEEPGNILKVG
jgi:hypothetical protein